MHRFEYTKADFKDNQHLVFHVWHKYEAARKHLLDSWQDPRMTGFRLRWSLRDKNGNQVPAQSEAKYKTREEDKLALTWLNKMVQVARKAREQGTTREALLELTLKEKMKQDWFLQDFQSKCKRGHLRTENFEAAFTDIVSGMNGDDTVEAATREDCLTGFMMFSFVIYCPESVINLYQYIDNITSNQSKRTVLQATLNTIWSGDLKNTLYERKIDGYYNAIEKVLDLDYGKILLASIPSAKLEKMVQSEMPFFANYSTEVNQCLGACNEASCRKKCEGLKAVVESLGK